MKSKKCPMCDKVKSAENYHKSNAAKTGLSVYCKPCSAEKSKRYHSPHYVSKRTSKPLTESSGVILTPAFLESKEKTPLDFLASIQKTSRLNWSYDQALGLVMGLKRAFDKGAIDLKECYAKYAPNKSYGACNALIKELKQALAAGMSLEDYWKTGRKFRAGAKVLVEGKK